MRRKVIMTSGVFDLCHPGHIHLLRRSKSLGDVLVVGVVSDAGAEAYKRRPMQSEGERLTVVGALRMVDRVFLQATTDPTPLIERVAASDLGCPTVFTHGSDWAQLREGQETLDRLGIEYVSLPYTQGISTGALIERILERGAEAVR